MILSFNNFRKGLTSPSKCRISGGAGKTLNIDTEFMTLKNMFPLRDGSITRRPGLTQVANFKVSASKAVAMNRNLFWFEGGARWHGCDEYGYVGEVKEDLGANGFTRILGGIGLDRMTMGYLSVTGLNYYVAGSTLMALFVPSTSLWTYSTTVTGNCRKLFNRNSLMCGTAYRNGVLNNRIYYDWIAGSYVDIDKRNDIIEAEEPGNSQNILVLKKDGSAWVFNDRGTAYVTKVANFLDEPIPYTMISTPGGIFWSTVTGIHSANTSQGVSDGLEWTSITDSKFQYPNVLLDAKGNGNTSYTYGVWGSDLIADSTPSVTPAGNTLTAGGALTSDTTDETTGKTATASSENGAQVAGLAIDDDAATYWQSVPGGVTASEWWKVDFGAGVTKTINTIRISHQGIKAEFADSVVIAGSTDDATYVTLVQEEVKTTGTVNNYSLTNTVGYRYIRITGATYDMGAASFYARINELQMYEWHPDDYIHCTFDFGAGVTKVPARIRYQLLSASRDTDVRGEKFYVSANGSAWTEITPAGEAQFVDSTYTYIDQLFTDLTGYRYWRWSTQRSYLTGTWYAKTYATNLFELTATASTTVSGMSSTAGYNPRTKEYWVHYLDSAAVWQTRVYNQVLDCFWRFQCAGFEDGRDSNGYIVGGSFGNKNKDFYLALGNKPSASTANAGLFRYGDSNTSDPHAAMALQARTGYLDLPGIFSIRNIYIHGEGLTTFNLYWEFDDPNVAKTGTFTQTLTGMTKYQFAPENAVHCGKLSWEILGTIGTAEGTKAVKCDLVEFDIDFVRDFTGGRSR